MAVDGFMAKTHPPLPKWLFYLQIAACILALGVLITAAINLDTLGDYFYYYNASSGPSGLLIFNVIFTWLILISLILLPRYAPAFYLRLPYIVLLCLASILWLSAWAWAASVAASFPSSRLFRSSTLGRYRDSMSAGAALGAFTWVAVTVFAGFYILACFRDDRSPAPGTGVEMQGARTGDAESAPVPPPGGTYDDRGLQDNPYHGSQGTQKQTL